MYFGITEKVMYRTYREVLFRIDAETAHSITLNLVRLAAVVPGLNTALKSYFQGPQIPVEAFGLNFVNPVGLAAGYDKDGLAWRGLSLLGFGHIEIGTVTPITQSGNPRPRIFRLVEDQAIINRMGFPSRGAEFLNKQLESGHPNELIIGVNLGMNEATSLESAYKDYSILLRYFAGLADYLVINISSPNTVGLRCLQARQALDDLLKNLREVRQEEENKIKKKIPLLVKLAPDLSDKELDDALIVILSNQIDGVIATNTTVLREDIHSRLAAEVGGLSGRPLADRSTEMVRKLNSRTGGGLPIIAAGGVMNATDAKAKLDAGAILVQIYTGLIYSGPGLVKQILNELSD
jgi:dihydroorotate dehydrogenase